MVNYHCSGYPPSPMMWLSESWGRMGQAIDRTETESSAVLLCRSYCQTAQQVQSREPAVSLSFSFAVSLHPLTTLLPTSFLYKMCFIVSSISLQNNIDHING